MIRHSVNADDLLFHLTSKHNLAEFTAELLRDTFEESTREKFGHLNGIEKCLKELETQNLIYCVNNGSEDRTYRVISRSISNISKSEPNPIPVPLLDKSKVNVEIFPKSTTIDVKTVNNTNEGVVIQPFQPVTKENRGKERDVETPKRKEVERVDKPDKRQKKEATRSEKLPLPKEISKSDLPKRRKSMRIRNVGPKKPNPSKRSHKVLSVPVPPVKRNSKKKESKIRLNVEGTLKLSKDEDVIVPNTDSLGASDNVSIPESPARNIFNLETAKSTCSIEEPITIVPEHVETIENEPVDKIKHEDVFVPNSSPSEQKNLVIATRLEMSTSKNETGEFKDTISFFRDTLKAWESTNQIHFEELEHLIHNFCQPIDDPESHVTVPDDATSQSDEIEEYTYYKDMDEIIWSRIRLIDLLYDQFGYDQPIRDTKYIPFWEAILEEEKEDEYEMNLLLEAHAWLQEKGFIDVTVVGGHPHYSIRPIEKPRLYPSTHSTMLQKLFEGFGSSSEDEEKGLYVDNYSRVRILEPIFHEKEKDVLPVPLPPPYDPSKQNGYNLFFDWIGTNQRRYHIHCSVCLKKVQFGDKSTCCKRDMDLDFPCYKIFHQECVNYIPGTNHDCESHQCAIEGCQGEIFKRCDFCQNAYCKPHRMGMRRANYCNNCAQYLNK